MAARNRPRALPKEDADVHEERDLWTKIVKGLRELANMAKRIQEIEMELPQEQERLESDSSSWKDYEAVEILLNEQRDLSEKEQKTLGNVIGLNDLLIALRTATEGGDRGVDKKRGKRKLDDAIASDSPSNRNTKVARSMSAAPTPVDALQLNAEVAYRLPRQKNAEGEWIQCIIVNVVGDGNKRKFEVQDPEPDEAAGHGTTYKASANALIPIPKESGGLPTYPIGTQVLARYPETTTFYRAEVMGTKRDGTCRLKFEGEEEVGKETEVERRLVLDVGNK